MELKLKALENEVQYQKDLIAGKEAEISQAKRDLAKIGRPEITRKNFDKVISFINKAVMDYDFSEVTDYEYDFEIDYDSRLILSSIHLNHTDRLEQQIELYIEDEFNIIEEE